MENLTSSFEEIGVKEAQTLLLGNGKNRPLNKENLSFLESEIKRGQFKSTGEAIKVSKTGRLLDGQHRLMAIVNAKPEQPITMLVVRGLEDEVFKFIDTGRKRTASDILSVQGIANATAIAGMAKFIINFDRGLYSSAVDHQNKKKARNTNNDISQFVINNKDRLFESFRHGYSKDNKIINKGLLASFHFIVSKISRESADLFVDKLSNGQSLESNDPIYILRQKFLSDIRAINKMSPTERIALMCKAWNLHRKLQSCDKLKWNSVRDPFPKLV